MRAAKLATLQEYRRTRHWITGIVVLGIVVSMLLNVKHAPTQGGWVAMLIGGFPPFAVFACIELITKVPMSGRLAAFGRILMTLVVTGLAAWISYESQADYVIGLGFTGTNATTLPIVIDGLMGVATLSLVEVSRKLRQLRTEIVEMDATAAEAVAPVAEPARAVVQPTQPTRKGRRHGPQIPPARRKAEPRTTLKASAPEAPQTKPEAITVNDVRVTDEPVVTTPDTVTASL